MQQPRRRRAATCPHKGQCILFDFCSWASLKERAQSPAFALQSITTICPALSKESRFFNAGLFPSRVHEYKENQRDWTSARREVERFMERACKSGSRKYLTNLTIRGEEERKRIVERMTRARIFDVVYFPFAYIIEFWRGR